MVIKETESYLLEYLPDIRSIRHILNRSMTIRDWQDLLAFGTDYLKENHITKWISDNRKNDRDSSDTTDWINNVWLPSAIQAGWKTWAVIEPAKFTSKLNQRIYKASFRKMGINVGVFSSPDEAEEWIRKQPE
jgi:hypothetical protein